MATKTPDSFFSGQGSGGDLPLSNDEICGNGIDDDSDGRRMDEQPYCSVIPGPTRSEELKLEEECVAAYCGLPLSNDEICRNGIDDDKDGRRVDEDPYCNEVPGVSSPRPTTDDTLTPEISQGHSQFGPPPLFGRNVPLLGGGFFGQ
jgi:hypothetical protein